MSITLLQNTFELSASGVFNEVFPATITVHELAHNWHHDPHFTIDFVPLSGWQAFWLPGKTFSPESKLWFNSDAEFARPGANASPLEDWATTFEVVFYADELNPTLRPADRLKRVDAKVDVVVAFLARF